MAKEDYSRPEYVDQDRRFHLARLGFQTAFTQAISGRDFAPPERQKIAGKIVFYKSQMDERTHQLRSLGDIYSSAASEVLKGVMKGDYGEFKNYISKSANVFNLMNEARGHGVDQEIKAVMELALGQFREGLPDVGLGWGTLLDEKRDKAILDELRTRKSEPSRKSIVDDEDVLPEPVRVPKFHSAEGFLEKGLNRQKGLL